MTITDRLQNCYTGAIYDVMKQMGVSNSTLPSDIRPTDDALTLAGPIWTCSGRLDESASEDETLVAWTGLLSAAPEGSVVVCQPNDGGLAHMGELSAETLKLRGIRGYVVDGGCRDVDFIRRLEWPVFCRYYTPADVVGQWVAGGLGRPIEIGAVTICTGDYLLADIDGVVVIPEGIAEDVVTKTEEIINTESDLRRDILAGMDPREAYQKYRIF